MANMQLWQSEWPSFSKLESYAVITQHQTHPKPIVGIFAPVLRVSDKYGSDAWKDFRYAWFATHDIDDHERTYHDKLCHNTLLQIPAVRERRALNAVWIVNVLDL